VHVTKKASSRRSAPKKKGIWQKLRKNRRLVVWLLAIAALLFFGEVYRVVESKSAQKTAQPRTGATTVRLTGATATARPSTVATTRPTTAPALAHSATPKPQPTATRAAAAPTAASAGVKSWSQPPAMSSDPKKKYTATIVTDKGEIQIQLYADKAPNAVNSFVFLARQHFFDGVTFHRVVPGFMAQAGDPTGTGRGGPGYKFADEIDPTLKHDAAGVVAMANSGANTNGSQFYITYAPQPHLDGGFTIFGRVTAGMDVASNLTPRDPQKNPNAPPGDRIVTIKITEGQ
jgi:cyclophilin family peptidyl-prolyl cis-trans isomerase